MQDSGSSPDSEKKWKILSEKTIWEHPIVHLKEKLCQSTHDPSKKHAFYTLHSGEWCNVIAITPRNTIVMVKQWRIGNERTMTEFPGGIADVDDPSIEHSVLRELREETGYAMLPGARCEWLGSSYSNPAIFNNRTHSFIVGPVEKIAEPELDPGEVLETLEVPLEEFRNLLKRDEFQHALIQITYFHLILRSERGNRDSFDVIESFSVLP